ncbi:hypothetical protein Tco_1056182 [Tanacetum coccineum]|uniref:Uncharacterized protein n=1 Tax=Tanacetum coccineum TaxID=301880 RepID=A0ABQ5H393_9ASTR
MKRMGHDIVQDSIWEHDDDSEEDQEEDGDDGDTFDMWDITVEDVERIKKLFNVPDEIDEIVQPLILEPIHTTPPNDDYVAPATKSILDDLWRRIKSEISNVNMVNELCGYILWKPSRDFTRPLGPPRGLKGLFMLLVLVFLAVIQMLPVMKDVALRRKLGSLL